MHESLYMFYSFLNLRKGIIVDLNGIDLNGITRQFYTNLKKKKGFSQCILANYYTQCTKRYEHLLFPWQTDQANPGKSYDPFNQCRQREGDRLKKDFYALRYGLCMCAIPEGEWGRKKDLRAFKTG